MNELDIKDTTQSEIILKFFDNNGIIKYFTETFSFPEAYVKKNAVNFALKVKNLDAQNKDGKLLQQCSPQSKEQAFVNLLSWDIPSDNRDFYYLYNVNGNMKIELSYKGLIYIASKNGIELRGDLVFEGDELETKETSNGDTYEIKRKNIFGRKKIDGAFVYARFTNNISTPKLYLYSFEELEASRQAGVRKMFNKESPAWKSFPNSMYLKCAFRKALGIILSSNVNNVPNILLDDEMQEPISSPAPVFSLKTADFASQSFDMDEAEKVDEDFKQQQFAELHKQFDCRNINDEM